MASIYDSPAAWLARLLLGYRQRLGGSWVASSLSAGIIDAAPKPAPGRELLTAYNMEMVRGVRGSLTQGLSTWMGSVIPCPAEPRPCPSDQPCLRSSRAPRLSPPTWGAIAEDELVGCSGGASVPKMALRSAARSRGGIG